MNGNLHNIHSRTKLFIYFLGSIHLTRRPSSISTFPKRIHHGRTRRFRSKVPRPRRPNRQEYPNHRELLHHTSGHDPREFCRSRPAAVCTLRKFDAATTFPVLRPFARSMEADQTQPRAQIWQPKDQFASVWSRVRAESCSRAAGEWRLVLHYRPPH